MGQPASVRDEMAVEGTNKATQAALLESQKSDDSYTYRSLPPFICYSLVAAGTSNGGTDI